MRIALTGSGGTGKTTLLNELNKKLDYPVIQEGIREWLESNGFKDFKEMEVSDVIDMQTDVMAGKIKEESVLVDFISDRTTVDNLSYALRWIGSETSDHDEWMKQYLNDAMHHAKNNYDIVFVLPWGSFDIENDGTRSNKKYYQYMLQTIIECHLYALMTSGESNIYVHKIEAVNLQERVIECMRVMNHVDLMGRKVLKNDKVNEDD